MKAPPKPPPNKSDLHGWPGSFAQTLITICPKAFFKTNFHSPDAIFSIVAAIVNKIGSLATPTAIKNSLANAVAVEGKYPYLYDKTTKNWTTSTTVRNVFVMGSGGVGTSQTNTNAWMNGGSGHKGSVGPELGIGGMLEAAFPTKPIMMLKSCIGDRALGWDLLPPGSKVRRPESVQNCHPSSMGLLTWSTAAMWPCRGTNSTILRTLAITSLQ